MAPFFTATDNGASLWFHRWSHHFVGEFVKKLQKRAKLAHRGRMLATRCAPLTEASVNGATHRQIMRQTRQKSRAMVDRHARHER
jgi:hypothetical protein